LTYANIAQIAFIGKVSLCLQAHLAPSWDYKEGSRCAFFCHKTHRDSSHPSLHMMQLSSDDISGLLHHLEIGLVALSQSGLWYWHYAIDRANCVIALELSQPHSCLSNSKANNTQLETRGRHQWTCLGNRWAPWRPLLATEAAQRKRIRLCALERRAPCETGQVDLKKDNCDSCGHAHSLRVL
jgi:hypothetical protein